MGAEIGAATSIFCYDQKMSSYLKGTDRADVAALADNVAEHLRGDKEVYENPQNYFDEVIEIKEVKEVTLTLVKIGKKKRTYKDETNNLTFEKNAAGELTLLSV